MKFLNEYRSSESVNKMVEKIKKVTKNSWTLMEVCGGQTHSIAKFGLDKLIPKEIELVHGPGCPVCVTSQEIIDQAIELAGMPKVIFCSFGDMLRVPGSEKDLFQVKSEGGDVRTVYSPLDALKIAQENQDKDIVFFAVGFETTAPANAMAIYLAKEKGIKNFSILLSHFLVPPAIEAICSSASSRVQGFLAPGHVCAIMGEGEYEPLVKKFKVPIVITGFEPLDILEGILMCVQQLEAGLYELENQYSRAVRIEGNRKAVSIIQKVFGLKEQNWRGVGIISLSGFKLKEEYQDFDAQKKFGKLKHPIQKDTGCISGQIMLGIKKPYDCPFFGSECRPEFPLGAPMVSSEGACAAYYRYRNLGDINL